MRDHIIPFAIAVGTLVIAVSVWVVLQAQTPSVTPIVFPETTTNEQGFFDRLGFSDPLDSIAAPTEPAVVTEPVDTPADIPFDTPADVAPADPVAETSTDTGFFSFDFGSTEPTTDTPADVAEAIVPPRPADTAPVSQPVTYEDHMAAAASALLATEYAVAVTHFSAAAQLQSEHIEPLLGLAEAQYYLRDYDKARANLAAVEQIDPTHPELMLLTGRILLRQEKFPDAEQVFARAGDTGTFYRAVMAAFYDRTDEAAELFRRVADTADAAHAADANTFLTSYSEYAIFPDSPKAHLDTLLARSFVSIGEYELAIAKLTPVVAADPAYRDAWTLLGYAELARTEHELARQALQTAYDLDSTHPDTQYLLGLTFIELKNYTEAERFLLLAEESNPDRATKISRRLAEIYFETGNHRAAADRYTALLTASESTSIQDYIRPTHLYLDLAGDGRAAWTVASLALERHGDTAMAYNLAGWVSVANNYLPEAKSYLDRAIELDPNLAAAHYNLGRYYQAAGDLDNALASYKQAFELDPTGSVGKLAAERYNGLINQ